MPGVDPPTGKNKARPSCRISNMPILILEAWHNPSTYGCRV
ncbi:hypothetical protein [Methanosarcina sp. 1.H.A.2.2]|nr:hypothetical protein [Methanosarcina sp. 1.H.A.2.2]